MTACIAITAMSLVAGCRASSPTDTVAPVSGSDPLDTAVTESVVSPTSAFGKLPRPEGSKTVKVPGDFPTIQAAVDEARPNDLVLIAPGTYAEAVIVRTPNVVIRGEDRNTVILDGNDELENGILVGADGVAVENLTVKRYTVNGVVFTKAYDAADPDTTEVLVGYRASYVTVSNNGLYGLYAYFAQGGVFDHVYGSGHPDGGIYIGQCKPCDALVTDAVMELNGIGYSGTNASGNLFVVNSIWRRNRIGMTPNSQLREKLSPQEDVTIAGNLVEDNDDPNTPPAASGAFGFGIAVGGGERNVIVRNRVRGNGAAGIAITTLDDFVPSGNRVEGNEVSDNGVDLAFYSAIRNELKVATNCFTSNTFGSSLPADIEQELPCTGGDVNKSIQVDPQPFLLEGPPPFDYRKIPVPQPQPQMPEPLTSPASPATAMPPKVDVTTIKVPS